MIEAIWFEAFPHAIPRGGWAYELSCSSSTLNYRHGTVVDPLQAALPVYFSLTLRQSAQVSSYWLGVWQVQIFRTKQSELQSKIQLTRTLEYSRIYFTHPRFIITQRLFRLLLVKWVKLWIPAFYYSYFESNSFTCLYCYAEKGIIYKISLSIESWVFYFPIKSVFKSLITDSTSVCGALRYFGIQYLNTSFNHLTNTFRYTLFFAKLQGFL